jgi:hypothetical protein
MDPQRQILFEEVPLGELDYGEASSSLSDAENPGVCSVLRIAALKAVGAVDEREPGRAGAKARTVSILACRSHHNAAMP